MNREIKFRAWDTERNQFVPQGEIIFTDYGDTNIEVHPNDLSYIGDSCHNGEPQRGRFIITQFTGLKDKNSKEIYEGDILENPEKKKGVVVFHDGSFVLQIHKSETSVHYITMNQGYCGNKRIIGNIYESPELIK